MVYPTGDWALETTCKMSHARYLSECNLWDHYLTALMSWGDFKGRSTRCECWGYALFYTLIFVSWAVLFRAIGGIYQDVLIAFYHLLFLIPTAALFFRRLHDTGKSGWFASPIGLFAALLVILQGGFYDPYHAGAIVLYILFILSAIAGIYCLVVAGFYRSEPGDNAYGSGPYPVRPTVKEQGMSTVEI